MHIWTDIFVRELAMLVTLLALGSGPASFLGRRFDTASRIAMAPVLGLALGTCAFTTLIWFTPAHNTYLLLPILGVASMAIALRRGMRGIGSRPRDPDAAADPSAAARPSRSTTLAGRLHASDLIALVLVAVVVAAPISYTLHERHSVGPLGFEVWDATGYTAEIDGMAQESIRSADQHNYLHAHNFIESYWAFYASGDQNLDAAPLSANVNELIGLHATDTQSLFLIVFLVAGALGAFAALRYFAPKPRWIAPLAGVLFAGPFFLQLITDGSQAATCGLGVILPLAAVASDVLRERRTASLLLLALLASALMALYPLFVPAVMISGAVVLASIAVRTLSKGQLDNRKLPSAAAAVGLVIALTILFNVVSLLRDLDYWSAVLKGTYYAGLPEYQLPYPVVFGWLLQTREFYSLSSLNHAPFHELLIGVILPVIFIVIMLIGLRRQRTALMLVALVLIYAAMALYTSLAHGCSYCTDRALLPIAPLSIGLFVFGVAALANAPSRWLRWGALAVALAILVAVGERTRQERLRFADGAYFLDSGNRQLLTHLPPHADTVDVEGYGEDPGKAPGEMLLAYDTVSEHNHGAVSVPSEYVNNASLAYAGEANPANPEFDPNYHYVLTRLGGVQTGRRVIARAGSLALEERTGVLDATLVTGVSVPFARLNANGLAWVEEPLHIIVAGQTKSPAWVSLRFQAIVPAVVPTQPGVRAHTGANGAISACVRATGTPPIRKATIYLTFPQVPGAIPSEPFALQEAPQGVQLVAMRAVSKCSLPSG
jgi:hypothetical protein